MLPLLDNFHRTIKDFSDFNTRTKINKFPDTDYKIPVYTNEFWTSRQKTAHSLHEISYRACFKPQLPRFFIKHLTRKGDVVYDPFMGRGTTVLESALLERIPVGCDINPLARLLVAPRVNPPDIMDIMDRLQHINLSKSIDIRDDLLVFYHPETLRAITNLREHILSVDTDYIDDWIRMVATNRLTGHSAGFFSVYTLPPSQTVSISAQHKINHKKSQTPPYKDIKGLIIRKSYSLLRDITLIERENLAKISPYVKYLTVSADNTPSIGDSTIDLIVTSPPFLDLIPYHKNNWLRCWFNGIDFISPWHFSDPNQWKLKIISAFKEFKRILKPEGIIAFEVGEIRKGKMLMETLVVPAAHQAGLTPEFVIVNDQSFTKTSNCWGVHNRQHGTNTNRIIIITI